MQWEVEGFTGFIGLDASGSFALGYETSKALVGDDLIVVGATGV